MLAGSALCSTVTADTSKAAPTKPVSTNSTIRAAAPRSLFITPNSVKEGRDPFFPDSTRVYDAVTQVNPNRKVDATSLVVRGISGSLNRRFVIINNHTFASGEEGDVLTATGRAHIHCVEIRSDSVVVEINGQRHVLAINPGK